MGAFIFARSSIHECLQLKELLSTYERASGQAVNLSKSSVAFSRNITEVDAQLLADCLGMERVDYHDCYLGLPVFISRSKKDTFAYIKDWMWKKLNGWRGSLLSSAGKEILIKVVAHAVPLYTMQTFLLPKSLMSQIKWWQGSGGEEKQISGEYIG